MTKLLVVDDSKSVHSYINDCFKKEGFSIEHVFNGQEAFDRIKAQSPDSSYDLVLLDWEMPVMSGVELLKKIKESALKIPVIMMTTRNSASDISQVLGLGVLEYIMKPFTKDIIFEKIESATGIKLHHES